MDREKIIKDLEFCVNGHFKVELSLATKILALLKEQEEKQTPKPIVHGQMEEYWGEEEICPDCGKRWQSADIDTTRFCPGCGRSVKWE